APTPAPKRKAGAKSAAPGLPQEPPVKKQKLMHKMCPSLSPEPENPRPTCRNSAAGCLNTGSSSTAVVPGPSSMSAYHQRAEDAGRGATTTFKHERAWTITPGGWLANTLYDTLPDFLVFAFGFILQIELFA
ncbi:hypothetical protein FRC10_011227, partial [Ceratobasidium sp. 414]